MCYIYLIPTVETPTEEQVNIINYSDIAVQSIKLLQEREY